MIVREDVEVASSRIGCLVRRTPVAKVAWDRSGRSTEVWFKLEHLQHTGSFKARGALNRVLSAAEQGQIGPAGVVAASGGTRAWPSRTLPVRPGPHRGSSYLPTPRRSR